MYLPFTLDIGARTTHLPDYLLALASALARHLSCRRTANLTTRTHSPFPYQIEVNLDVVPSNSTLSPQHFPPPSVQPNLNFSPLACDRANNA